MSYLDLYNQIKSRESVFTLPIPYFTVDVGTFDASTGLFTGLTTTTVTDPEPIEHGPGQHPVNPQPHFSGNSWISIVIGANWRRTVTTVPAPKVGLAPILLRFEIRNQNAPWTVTVAGQMLNLPAGQTFVTVNIWDIANLAWSITSGQVSHTDRLMIQRSAAQLVGAGAFTIPALPLSIVYAPPADAAKLSKASYQVSDSVGTTSTLELTSDNSTSQPWLTQNLSSLQGLQGLMNGLSMALSQGSGALKTTGEVLGAIATGIGTITGSATTGTVNDFTNTITITESNSQTIFAETANGGPGAGDSIDYLRDAKFVWLMSGGVFRIALLGGIYASFPAAYLAAHANDASATGLPPDVVQQLLAMDPFVAGGSMVALAADRYGDSPVQGPFEYGGGQTLTGSFAQTFSSSDTRSQKNYTVQTEQFNAGWLAKLFGQDGSGLSSTVSFTQAAGTTTTETQTISWELHSGLTERFVVELWLDGVFGTYAFRQEPVSTSPRLQGVATGANGLPLANAQVKLTTTAGRTYFATTGQKGHYAFFARNIPAGNATLVVASQSPKKVSVAIA